MNSKNVGVNFVVVIEIPYFYIDNLKEFNITKGFQEIHRISINEN